MLAKEKCQKCESEEIKIEKFVDDYGFDREKLTCQKCGEERIR